MDKPWLNVESNSLISLVLTLVLVGVIVWMNVMGVVKITLNIEQMDHSKEIEEVVQTLKEHLNDVETGERGYIITGKQVYLEPYEHGLIMVNSQRDELVRLLANSPAEQSRLAELKSRLDNKIAMSRTHVQARKQSFEAARALVMEGTGKREMDALREILNRMTSEQDEQQEQLQRQREQVLDEMKNNIAIATVASFVVLVILHLRLLWMMKQRNEAEQKMHHLASYDTLTELPNRRMLLAHMEQAMQRCLRNNNSMALLFLDLNGFKPVNDQYGHKAGDEVLKQVAHRLSGAMRASDRVARFGGDEFVVLAEDISEKEDVCGIVGKIDAEIYRPFLLKDGVAATISTSIGVAIYPRDGLDLESLLRIADTAMYAAKKSESNCYCKEQGQSRRCVLISDGER